MLFLFPADGAMGGLLFFFLAKRVTGFRLVSYTLHAAFCRVPPNFYSC